ncbi:MAG TPA: hypothetical protein VFV68_12945 [Agriterribacter sp.]|nr:hypothetical protein [Agriterribacter sp.]
MQARKLEKKEIKWEPDHREEDHEEYRNNFFRYRNYFQRLMGTVRYNIIRQPPTQSTAGIGCGNIM